MILPALEISSNDSPASPVCYLQKTHTQNRVLSLTVVVQSDSSSLPQKEECQSLAFLLLPFHCSLGFSNLLVQGLKLWPVSSPLPEDTAPDSGLSAGCLEMLWLTSNSSSPRALAVSSMGRRGVGLSSLNSDRQLYSAESAPCSVSSISGADSSAASWGATFLTANVLSSASLTAGHGGWVGWELKSSNMWIGTGSHTGLQWLEIPIPTYRCQWLNLQHLDVLYQGDKPAAFSKEISGVPWISHPWHKGTDWGCSRHHLSQVISSYCPLLSSVIVFKSKRLGLEGGPNIPKYVTPIVLQYG